MFVGPGLLLSHTADFTFPIVTPEGKRHGKCEHRKENTMGKVNTGGTIPREKSTPEEKKHEFKDCSGYHTVDFKETSNSKLFEILANKMCMYREMRH